MPNTWVTGGNSRTETRRSRSTMPSGGGASCDAPSGGDPAAPADGAADPGPASSSGGSGSIETERKTPRP